MRQEDYTVFPLPEDCLKMSVHMPRAYADGPGDKPETGHGLPPPALVKAYPVDLDPEFRDSLDKKFSFTRDGAICRVVGMKHGVSLWFDFRGLSDHPTHDVAVRVMVQDICALTGMPHEQFGMPLIQYRHRCPKHNEPFSPDLLCRFCGHRWPAQNYLSTADRNESGHPVAMRLNGFRDGKGRSRQFITTKGGEGRGIAEQILGNWRSFQFDISFTLSRKEKVRPPVSSYDHYDDDDATRGDPRKSSASTTEVEIAAGAVINHETGTDPNGIEYWNDDPAVLVRIYCMPEDELNALLAEYAERVGSQRSFLSGLKTGNRTC